MSRVAAVLADPNVRFGQQVTAWTAGVLLFLTVVAPAPPAILMVGVVFGTLSALIAMGVVLIYRANRIINFAQGEIGAVAGSIAVLLIASRQWPYFLALAAGLASALVVGALVEFLVIRRFTNAPRLILSVATIGIAQILAGVQIGLPLLFDRTVAPQDFPTPFEFTFNWPPVVFRGNHLLVLIVVVASGVGLALFFRRSRFGFAVRASAESVERASQLGIPVKRVGLLVWVLAAGLSAVGALLRAPLVGAPIGTVLGPALLLRALAAAVIGRMDSLPRTFAAAIGLGIVEQAVFWHTGRTTITDAVLFAVILGSLLVQRRRDAGRADDTGVSSWDFVSQVRPIPRELRELPEVRFGLRWVGGLAFALVGAAPLALSDSQVNLLGTGVVMAIIGLSMVVLTGWAGEISLGQMAFVGVGAVVGSRLAFAGMDFFVVLVAAGLAGAAVSVLIGVPALRIRGPFLAVATLAFALASSSFFFNAEFFPWLVVEERILRPLLFGIVDLENETAFFLVLHLALGLVIMSLRWVRSSRMGRVLLAVRDNPRGAQAYGVNLVRSRLFAFAMSGFVAALAGALYAYSQHTPGVSKFVPDESIRIFTMVVFGGLGSVPGVVLGAAYFTAVDYFLPLAELRFLVSGAGLLLVLLFVRGGLGGALYAMRDRLLRAIARRRALLVPSLLADRRDPAPPDRDDVGPAAEGAVSR